jgi:Flp pilus assembly protein TadB
MRVKRRINRSYVVDEQHEIARDLIEIVRLNENRLVVRRFSRARTFGARVLLAAFIVASVTSFVAVALGELRVGQAATVILALTVLLTRVIPQEHKFGRLLSQVELDLPVTIIRADPPRNAG